MEMFPQSGEGASTEPCLIFVEDHKIELKYDDDDGPVRYAGTGDGHGHYVLNCLERKGSATLHRSSKMPSVLEGSWTESGYRGMWCIDIDEDGSDQ
jgi:hypothetical protein